MKMSDRVTIITSPNGYGKTTILRLLHNLCQGRYGDIRKIPFRDFRITFEDDTSLEVVRVAPPKTDHNPGADLTITLFKGSKKEQQTKIPAIPKDALPIPAAMIERAIPSLTRIAPNRWRDKKTNREMDHEDVFRTYGSFYLRHDPKQMAMYSEAPWLIKFRESMAVKFIDVQRLLRAGKSSEELHEQRLRPTVEVYSGELASLIKAKLAEYATLSQSLDRSFPKRLVDKTKTKGRKSVPVPKLRQRLQELEDKRVKLTTLGLLDREDEPFDVPGTLEDPTLIDSVLPVYAEDGEQKLRVFDDIAAKISLLTTIVNAHFQFKELSIDRDRGFQFFTRYPGESKGATLPITHLSSGEQHMLVLLYELLFSVAPQSLVMIDEPEISLHVVWQLELLRDVQKITELIGFDALIATHAPGIISDRMDLKVDLKAPTE